MQPIASNNFGLSSVFPDTLKMFQQAAEELGATDDALIMHKEEVVKKIFRFHRQKISQQEESFTKPDLRHQTFKLPRQYIADVGSSLPPDM